MSVAKFPRERATGEQESGDASAKAIHATAPVDSGHGCEPRAMTSLGKNFVKVSSCLRQAAPLGTEASRESATVTVFRNYSESCLAVEL
jgi:hypothetical protein